MATEQMRENQININGLNINYKTIGNGDVLIILLHGWGISSDKYIETIKLLSLKAADYNLRLKIIVPDLPGFGKSEEPEENWDLDDYVVFVDRFIDGVFQKKGLEQVKNILKSYDPIKRTEAPRKYKTVLIGHSFGGRIAIKYAAKYPDKLDKLILTGAAGIKHQLSLKRKIFYVLTKTGREIFLLAEEAKLPVGRIASIGRRLLYKTVRERDYLDASPKMKEIMKKVISEDLEPILSQIKTPTLLVWGALDRSTPLSDGKIMHERIVDSELKTVEGADHGLPYRNKEEFIETVLESIKK